MAKAEEWKQPITEEALVRQGNEKCYQHRKKTLVAYSQHNCVCIYLIM